MRRHILTIGIITIPEGIYRHFILDFVKEVAKFLAAKNQAQVNAQKYVFQPTQPTGFPVIGAGLFCKITKNLNTSKYFLKKIETTIIINDRYRGFAGGVCRSGRGVGRRRRCG